MVNPTSGWDRIPVFGFFFKGDDVTPETGNVKFTMTSRVTRVDGRKIYPEGATVTRAIGDTAIDAAIRDAVRDAWRDADQAAAVAAGDTFDATAWNAAWNVMLTGAVFASFPASDDPNIVETGYQVTVTEGLDSGTGRVYTIQPQLSDLQPPTGMPPGINLGFIAVPPGSPIAPAPIYAKGLPGGVAALDSDGDVVDAAGDKILGGGGGTVDTSTLLVKASNLSDLPDKAAARTALQLGTAATHAVGDFEPAGAVASEATARQTAITAAINALVNGAPGALDTLNELAAQLGSDETAAGNLTTLVGAIRNLSDPTHAAALSATFAPLSKASSSVAVQGFNQAAIDAAYAAVVAAGGGTIVFPPGNYVGALNITANLPIAVLGYGATLKAAANNVTLVRISQGDGIAISGCVVQGLRLDGNGQTGVVGLAYEDTDGAAARDLYIKSCAVGVLFHTVTAAHWVERSMLANTFMTGCLVGIEFRKETAAMPSFNEVSLDNVGVSQCSVTGIKQGAGADFTRTTWRNVTIWCPDGAVGVEFSGRLDYARLQFGIESLGAGTGATAILVGSTYTFYADPYAHSVEVSIVGTFANRMVDNSTGGFGIVVRDGSNANTTQYAPALQVTKLGDTFPRVKIGSAGIEVGPGNAATVSFLQTFYGNYFKSSVNMLFQADPGFPNAAANGGSASKAIHVYGTADTYAGYVPVYATSDGPALVPSNAQTGTTYTVGPSDAGKAITMTNAAANVVNVPSVANGNSATIGTVIGIEQLGAGTTSIAAGAGVTINSRGGLLNLAGQYAAASLRKIGTDTWLLAGDLA